MNLLPLEQATIFKRPNGDQYALFAQEGERSFILLGVNGTWGHWNTGSLKDLQEEVNREGWTTLLHQTISGISRGWVQVRPWMVKTEDVTQETHKRAVEEAFAQFRKGDLTLNALQEKVLDLI